jgi:hypothetical protein
MTSPLDIPRGESPYIKNFDIGDGGIVRARNGTQYQAKSASPSAPIGNVCVPVEIRNGINLVVRKTDDDLLIGEAIENSVGYSIVNRISFTAVFPPFVANERVSYAVSSEETTRVFFCNKKMAPVQLQIVENTKKETKGTSFTTVVFKDVRFTHATSTLTELWINGVNTQVTGVSYNTGTEELTVTFASQVAGTYDFHIAYFSWQWICQGMLVEGKDLYGSETRFYASKVDVSQAIPTDLIKNNKALDPDNGYLYPIIPYRSADKGDYQTYQPLLEPSTVDEFVFSNGVTYIPSGSDLVVPGTTHITFGSNATGADPTETHFIKALRLNFDNDATTYPWTKPLTVYADGISINGADSSNFASFFPPAGKGYIYRYVPTAEENFYSNTSVMVATTGVYKYITFDVSEAIGINYSSVVEVIYPYVDTTYVGTAVQQFSLYPRTGYAFPFYGIQEHANYVKGSFPSVVSFFQGRLVLAGFTDKPMRVVMSEVSGSAINSARFTNYSQAYSELSATDPIVIDIAASQIGSEVTAVNSAAGSLLVFTFANSFRVFSTEGAVTPVNTSVSNIASVGCVNNFSHVQVANAVIFLSSSGVYRIAPALNIGDFDIGLLSANITNKLRQLNNRQYAWMMYDEISNKLFVAVVNDSSTKCANNLFVYFVQWNAWSEYTSFQGLWSAAHGCSIKLDREFQVMAYTFMPYSDTTDIYLISSPFLLVKQDFAFRTFEWVSSIVPSPLDEYDLVSFTHTFVAGDLYNYIKLTTFRMSEYLQIRDIIVLRNNVVTEEWHKVSENELFLTFTPTAGDVIRIYPVDFAAKFPLNVRKNLLEVAYTFPFNWTTKKVTVTITVPPLDLDEILVGFSIPYQYSTPAFVRNSLQSDTMHEQLYVLTDNREYNSRYDIIDANEDVSQPYADIYEQRKDPSGFIAGRYMDTRDIATLSGSAQNPSYVLTEFDLDNADFNSFGQSQKYSRVGINLSGSNSVVQAFLMAYDTRAFNIAAYQFIAASIGRSMR